MLVLQVLQLGHRLINDFHVSVLLLSKTTDHIRLDFKLNIKPLMLTLNIFLDLLKALYLSLIFLNSLLPHHDFLLVLLQLVLLIVHLDSQTGLLGLKLKTEIKRQESKKCFATREVT